MPDEYIFSPTQFDRRELGKIVIGGALGATFLSSSRSSSALVRPQPPGIKLGYGASGDPTDDDLLFFKQLGVQYVFFGLPDGFSGGVEDILRIKKRYSDAGLTVHHIAAPHALTTNNADIILNRPGRDKKIEDYKAYLRLLGKAGSHYTIANFDPFPPLLSGHAETRGSQTRECDLNSPMLGAEKSRAQSEWLTSSQGTAPGDIRVLGPANSVLIYGRKYNEDEIWANYTYFIKQVAPVAEEAGVAIAFHPDDPPAPSLYGVSRILSSFDGYKKAMEIANSPNVGITLCCGTWLEGGAAMGDPADAIRYFGPRKQIYEIHFRNVSSPLPHFHEEYVDNGYYDMYKVMKALVDVKYDGIVHKDHDVPMVGGNRTYGAFQMGYMRALLQRAQAGNTA